MSRLPIKVIEIPDNCIVRHIGNKVEVYEKAPRRYIPDGEYRCKDCKWRHLGFASKSKVLTTVCFKKPKTKGSYIYLKNIYYRAGSYDHICDKFEKK